MTSAPTPPAAPARSPGSSGPPARGGPPDGAEDRFAAILDGEARTAPAEGHQPSDSSEAPAPGAPAPDPSVPDASALALVAPVPAPALVAAPVPAPAAGAAPAPAVPAIVPAAPATPTAPDPLGVPAPPAAGQPSGPAGAAPAGPAPSAGAPPAAPDRRGGEPQTGPLAPAAAPAPAPASAGAHPDADRGQPRREPAPAPAVPASEAPPAAAAAPAVAAPSAPAAAPAAPAARPPAPAPQAPPAPPRPGAAVEQVHAIVRLVASRGAQHARVSLRPQELGGVEIRLHASAAGLVAQVTADTAATAHQLAGAATELRRTLADQGISLLRLDVGLAGDGDPSGSARRELGAQPRSGAGGDDAPASPDLAGEPGPEPAPVQTIDLGGGLLVDVLA
jgi:hypothetical protein